MDRKELKALRMAELRSCQQMGMSLREASNHLGISYAAVTSRSYRYGIKLRDTRSEHMKKQHECPEFTKKMVKQLQARHRDPVFAAQNRERARQAMLRNHANPEFRAKMVRNGHEQMRKMRSTPEAREKMKNFNMKLLDKLTPQEREDYRLLKNLDYPRKQALEVIGRNDLVREVEEHEQKRK